tara:strand:+ start:862 stop:1830 length:969 start_codon:yes stop_codon:yes gene_type:complete
VIKLLNYIKPVIFLALGLFLLFISFRGIDWGDFKEALNDIPLRWALLSMLFGYLAYVFRGLRWYLLIQPSGTQTRVIDLVHAIAFGYLFNSLIPRSGEIVRCTALNKVTGIPVSKLFGHVILERLIDFILLALCAGLALLFNYKDFLNFLGLFSLSGSKTLIYGLIFLGILLIIYISIKYFLSLEKLHRITQFLIGIKEGFLAIKNIPQKMMFLIYTLLIWVCYLFMTAVCFYCFTETADFNMGHGLFILVAGGLGMVIPTPTGIGSYHYLVIQALMIINISREIAQFFAIIVHTSQAIMIIVAGFVGMALLYQKKKENAEA